MNRFFENVTTGQNLVTKNGKKFTAVNPHVNTDEPDKPFIVYDDENNSYFEEDIDIEQSIMQTINTDAEHIVFSKFHVPKEAVSVQAVLIYSNDDGKTWSGQIPAEHTIACPDEMEYLPVKGDKKEMRQLAHNFIEDTWRDGFNTCLELFKTGKLDVTEQPTHASVDVL